MVGVRTTTNFETDTLVTFAHLIHLNGVAVTIAKGTDRTHAERLVCWIFFETNWKIPFNPLVNQFFYFVELFARHLAVNAKGRDVTDTLLRAAALVAPRRPELRVHIAGDGVARPGLVALARRLGIEDRCSFPGRVARSEAILHQAALDVFAVPRRDLPVTRSVTPMKTVEASAVGRPVVASDLPALAELVEDGRTGLLVPAEDPAALAEALERLAADPAERERLGAAGRQWALATRTWAGNARRYRDLYARLGVSPR